MSNFSKDKFFDILIFVAVGLAVFYRSFDIQFVGDNLDHIKNAGKDIFDFGFHYYRPLTILTLIVDKVIWGYNYIGYHISNLALHMTNVILVYLLAYRFLNVRYFAFVAALLFLVHPIHSSSLFWISGRVDMLCAVFYIGGLLSFIEYTVNRSKAFFIFTIFCLVSALLSKEMAITFPLTTSIYFYLFHSVNSSAKLKSTWTATRIFWIITFLFILIRIIMAGLLALTADVHTNFGIVQLFKNLATFVGLLVLPGGHLEIGDFLKNHTTIFFFAVSICLISLLFVLKKIMKDFHLLFFTLLTLIPLLPVLRLAMRWYLYIPSIGFCLVLSYLLWNLLNKSDLLRKGAILIFAVIALTYTLFISLEQNRWIKSGELATLTSEKLAARIVLDNSTQCLVLNPPGEFMETPVLIHGLESLVNFKLNSIFGIEDLVEVVPVSFVSVRGSVSGSYPYVENIRQPDKSDSTKEMVLSLKDSESFFEFPYQNEILSGKKQLSPGYKIEANRFDVEVLAINEQSRAKSIKVTIKVPSISIYLLRVNRVENI